MKSLIEKAYSPENFRTEGHRLIDQLADYLHQTIKKQEGPVFQLLDPEDNFRMWNEQLDHPHRKEFNEWSEQVIDKSIHLHHPGYMGHQVSATLPEAALAELMGAVLNNGMGVYEMGSPTVAMERVVIKKLAKQLGFDKSADGILTSGGTLGNLTALLAMRQIKGGMDSWSDGTGNQKFAVMISEEAHYSVSRAIKIIGWGDQGLIKVPVDDQLRLNPPALEQCYKRAQEEGLKVLGIIGNACSTATGSFDPLSKIADFCAGHDLWLHVDAAHGGSASFSKKYKHLLADIHRADSVIVDFHKVLMCPALVTGVVFRNGDDSYKAFAQKASYLWEKENPEWFNLGKRTFECTKSMMALKVYAIVREYGNELFEEIVDRLFDIGKTFGKMIEKRPDFELLTQPECNIVCFRFVPTEGDADELNKYVRKCLLQKGNSFVVQTQLKGKLYLRTTLMNPFTDVKHLAALLDEIEEHATAYHH